MSRLLYQFVLTTAVIGLPQSENNKVEEENVVASRMKANERWRWWWRWLPSDEQAKQKEKKNNKRLIYTQSIFADLFNYISRLPIALRLPLHITTTACRRSCAVTISTYLPKAGRQSGVCSLCPPPRHSIHDNNVLHPWILFAEAPSCFHFFFSISSSSSCIFLLPLPLPPPLLLLVVVYNKQETCCLCCGGVHDGIMCGGKSAAPAAPQTTTTAKKNAKKDRHAHHHGWFCWWKLLLTVSSNQKCAQAHNMLAPVEPLNTGSVSINRDTRDSCYAHKVIYYLSQQVMTRVKLLLVVDSLACMHAAAAAKKSNYLSVTSAV